MRRERERITQAMDALTSGLGPFVEREMEAAYHDQWRDVAVQSFRNDRGLSKFSQDGRWDAHAILTVMWDQWNRVFRGKLDHAERSLVSELREYRNRWAHQVDFDFDDAYRILDSAERLLAAVEADERNVILREKTELLRSHFNHEARVAYRKAQIARRRWHDLTIYLVCAASLIFVMAERFGWDYWFFSFFIALIFGYLAYSRVTTPAPAFIYGPHECPDCGKIIYGESCPYCEERPANPPKKQATTAVEV